MLRSYYSALGLALFTACQPPVPTATTPAAPATSLVNLDSLDRANQALVPDDGDDDAWLAKAYVDPADSSISLTANMRTTHRFFGYAQPDKSSQRLLLLSVFTSDVENNPFGCPLGAYYSTPAPETLSLHYRATVGDFVEVIAVDAQRQSTTLYLEKKWVSFE